MLEEYIKDAIDDEMKDYLTTETYKQQGEEIEKLLYSLRSELTPDQVSTLNRLVNVLGQQHSDFASAAYLRGVVSGIALKNKTLDNKSELKKADALPSSRCASAFLSNRSNLLFAQRNSFNNALQIRF